MSILLPQLKPSFRTANLSVVLHDCKRRTSAKPHCKPQKEHKIQDLSYLPGLRKEFTVGPGGLPPSPRVGGSQHCVLGCQHSKPAALTFHITSTLWLRRCHRLPAWALWISSSYFIFANLSHSLLQRLQTMSLKNRSRLGRAKQTGSQAKSFGKIAACTYLLEQSDAWLSVSGDKKGGVEG